MALMVVLALLAAAMVLGAASAQLSLFSERGARNDRDMQSAFAAAEAALLDAERELQGHSPRQALLADPNSWSGASGCGQSPATLGLCPSSGQGRPVWLAIDLSDPNQPTTTFGQFTQRSWSAAQGVEQASTPPRYLIEHLSSTHDDTAVAYRVTAIGFAPNPKVHAVIQSIYRMPAAQGPADAESGQRLGWRSIANYQELRHRTWPH
ncbi:MAG: pilus assembly protein [Comamonas sp.]